MPGLISFGRVNSGGVSSIRGTRTFFVCLFCLANLFSAAFVYGATFPEPEDPFAAFEGEFDSLQDEEKVSPEQPKSSDINELSDNEAVSSEEGADKKSADDFEDDFASDDFDDAFAEDLGSGGDFDAGFFEEAVDDSTGFSASSVESPTSPGFFSKLSWGGYVKNETAYRYDEPRSITKIRNIFSLNVSYPYSSKINFFANGWAYHDLAYDLFDYETIAARFVREEKEPLVFVDNLAQEKDSDVIDLREIYIDIFTSDMDFRLGKQFVVWGVLEGIRITDEINPQDYREMIAPDLLDYRVGLWTLKVEHYLDSGTIQYLWIPDIQFHKPAPRGSEWELMQEVPNTVFPDTFRLENSEVGIRYTTEWQDFELAFSYLFTWDDFPVIFREEVIQIVEDRSGNRNNQAEPEFFPTYTRINMFGGTVVKQWGPTVIKGEYAFVPDKFFGTKSTADSNNDGFLDDSGVIKKKHLRWGLGVDFNIWGADISPAISQWIIFDYEKRLLQDEFDSSFALYIRKPAPQISAVFSLLWIQLFNFDELYAKPKVVFDVTDQFQISAGAELFYGKRSNFGVKGEDVANVSVSGNAVSGLTNVIQNAQFFGNFHDNDRIFMEFKYTF